MAAIRNLRADTKILFGSLLLIALLSVITVLTAPTPNAPSLSVRSDRADGAMALQRWLQRSGYQVHEILSLGKQLSSVNVLFVLEPSVSFSDADILLVQDWVRQGNRLIVVGAPYSVNDLLEPYEISLGYPVLETDAIPAAAPTLLHPVFEAAAVE